MNQRELTPQEEADRLRLVEWMKANNYTDSSLALVTGDFYTAVRTMTVGDRRVSQAFKHRFYAAFGHEVFEQVFPTRKTVAVPA